jgi:hypothetical protein
MVMHSPDMCADRRMEPEHTRETEQFLVWETHLEMNFFRIKATFIQKQFTSPMRT